MHQRSTTRVAAALAAALGALILSVAPAAAFEEQVNTGTTVPYTFMESPGARCVFENNPGQNNDELDKVKAAEFFTHGPYAQLSKIVVRFQWQRNNQPHNDHHFVTVAHTPNIVKFADDSVVAHFGPKTYTVPEHTPDQWRVRVLINYYNVAGTQIVGKVRGLIQVYRHQRAGTMGSYTIGTDGVETGYCRTGYHATIS